MKRIIAGVIMAVLLVAVGNAARAEEGTGMEVEAGLKWWCNQWKRSTPNEGSDRSKRTPLIGPVVEATLPNGIFAEASYLFSGKDYQFNTADGLTTKVERSDIDLVVGYKVLHGLGVFAGYRNSAFKEKETGVKETAYGPQAGVRGSFPLNEKLALTGSLAYLAGKFKTEDALVSATEKSPGWVAELGAKYAFSKQVSAALAYQRETSKGKESDVKDAFTGLALRAMYAFE